MMLGMDTCPISLFSGMAGYENQTFHPWDSLANIYHILMDITVATLETFIQRA